MNKTRQNPILYFSYFAAGTLMMIVVLGLMGISLNWLIVCLLVGAGALAGYTLGIVSKNAGNRRVEIQLTQTAPADESSRDSTTHRVSGSGPNPDAAIYAPGILDELCLMQGSHELLYRYQCFTRLVEKVLNHALGPCGISLWCPDQEHRNLIECVIKPAPKGAVGSSADLLELPETRSPYRLPLNVPEIIESLESGTAFLASGDHRRYTHSERKNTRSLICHACIPLYREYGQPLLINVEFSNKSQGHPEQRKNSVEDGFSIAVKLVKLFWNHLQATNQRQWSIEHDPDSGVLRSDVFMRQGQNLAQQCRERDELFSVVVITMRGFRSMFTQNAQQWSRLAGLFGRCLDKVLSGKGEDFLLARMADDVFAVLLPRTDEFLARSIMRAVTERLAVEMNRDQTVKTLDVMGVDIQWTLADQKYFAGSFEKMLEKMYRRLFTRGPNKQDQTYKIILKKHTELTMQ